MNPWEKLQNDEKISHLEEFFITSLFFFHVFLSKRSAAIKVFKIENQKNSISRTVTDVIIVVVRFILEALYESHN